LLVKLPMRVSQMLFLFLALVYCASACSVIMYTNENFLGNSKTFLEDQADLVSEFAGQITSMKVESGCGVIVYKERNYRGVQSFFDGQRLNMNAYGFNDQIYSFKIVDLNDYGCAAVFYSDENFGGDAQFYPAYEFPSYWSAENGNHFLYHNDYYSSLRIVGKNAAQCAVVAWENTGRNGQNRYFGNEDHPQFGDFNDRISSFWIVQKSTCAVVFYEDHLFFGDARYYNSDANSLGGQNDHFSSFKVLGTSSCHLTVYKDVNRPQGGAHLTYTAPHDQENMPYGWNDVISSFDIHTGSAYNFA